MKKGLTWGAKCRIAHVQRRRPGPPVPLPWRRPESWNQAIWARVAMWGSQQVVKCGWYNLHHDPVCIAKKRNLGRSWNIVEKNQGAKRAGIGANRAGIPIPLISTKDKLSLCGARKPSIRTFMLLQTRTCETVDCMVITSQHRISSKPDQNPFMREKRLRAKQNLPGQKFQLGRNCGLRKL